MEKLSTKLKNYKDLPFEEKMDLVEDITATIISQYGELLDSVDGEDRSFAIGSKGYNEAVKSMTSLLGQLSKLNIYNRESAMKDNIDFNHPKIQKGMYFLIEAVIDSMKESDIDDTQIAVFSNTLSLKLVGFEDQLNSTLKKLASTLVDTAKNPLIEKILNGEAR